MYIYDHLLSLQYRSTWTPATFILFSSLCAPVVQSSFHSETTFLCSFQALDKLSFPSDRLQDLSHLRLD